MRKLTADEIMMELIADYDKAMERKNRLIMGKRGEYLGDWSYKGSSYDEWKITQLVAERSGCKEMDAYASYVLTKIHLDYERYHFGKTENWYRWMNVLIHRHNEYKKVKR